MNAIDRNRPTADLADGAPAALPDPVNVADDLLRWYDRHARRLPWRALPGATADPYRVWLSEIMLQQTTVATVRPRFADFLGRWGDVRALAAADDAEVMAAWAGLGYYARARNLLACARAVVERHAGAFPADEAALRALPGIGAYTAAAIAAIAFGRRAVVVDGNVERVVARLFAVETPIAQAKARVHALTDQITPAARAGDFAQAMMDLGAGPCRPRAPDCPACPIRARCRAAATGQADRLPVKPVRAAKPQRHGTAFWLEDAGRVWLIRRPPRGLLGGMRALPTGPWRDTPPGLAEAPGEDIAWQLTDRRIDHVFTHFRLELTLAVARADGHAALVEGEWWPIDRLESAGMPSLFAKIAAMGAI